MATRRLLLLICCLLIGPSSRHVDGTAPIKISTEVNEDSEIGHIVTDLALRERDNDKDVAGMCEVMKQTLSTDNSTAMGRKVSILDVKADGEVFIKEAIDREALCGKSQECKLSLLIGNDPSFYRVYVDIDDVNDNKPIFPACNATTDNYDCQLVVNVPESLELDSRVQVDHLRATDADIDTNGKVYYRMTDEYFELDNQDDGLFLKLKKPLDFERDSTHTFKLQALDHGLDRQLTSPVIDVLVKISNVNDNAPIFVKNPYEVEVNEGRDINDVLVKVKALDHDASPYNDVTYRLAKDNDYHALTLVEVDGKTGEVRLKRKVDSKLHNGMEIRIEALDHLPEGEETRYGHTILRITVEDMNNNDPEINFIFSATQNVVEEKSTGAVYIPEDIKPDAYFAVVEATDADVGDNAMIVLQINPSTDDDNIFELQKISSDVGHYQAKLMINTALDRENRKSYCVNVQACDQGSKKRCAVKRLNIELLDVNDNPPVFSQTIDMRVNIAENSSIGTVVATIHADDLDSTNPPVYMREGDHKVHSTNGDVTYMIVHGRGGDFVVDAVTGEVRVNQELDRERNEQYHLTIVARDNGKTRPLESSMTLYITVLDINDNMPEIYEPEENENIYATTIKDQIITTIQATDADRGSNAQLSFSLVNEHMSEEDLELFKLDDKSGELRLNFNLGAEKLEEKLGPHYLSIEVRDHGKAVQRAVRNFVVKVINTPIPLPPRKSATPSGHGANVTSLVIGVIIAVLLLFVLGFAFLWYRRCYMGRNKSCPINEKSDKHEHKELLQLDSYSNKDKNTNDSSSRASGEWKESANVDNSRYDEMREMNVANEELQMRKPSYTSNMAAFDPRSSNVSSMNTKMSNLSSVTKQQECDSGRGDSSPDAISHVEVVPFQQNRMSPTTSNDHMVVMETAQLRQQQQHGKMEEEELGPYCTATCLSQGHHDGCWINLNPVRGPYGNVEMLNNSNPTNSPPPPSTSQSLYVDLYPQPQVVYNDSGAPSSGSHHHHHRHFVYPTTTSTLTSIYSNHAVAPEQRHYARDIYGGGGVMPTRPSSALPHKQNRIIHSSAAASPSSSVSARRYNNSGSHFIAGYNVYSPPPPAAEAPRPANKFRRSASTDAILRSGDHPVAMDNGGDGDEEMSLRQTRAIVANIEKLLLSNK